MPTIIWTSPNKRWTIERLSSGRVIVADNRTGWNDTPAKTPFGLIWDWPERVPAYVKAQTLRILGSAF